MGRGAAFLAATALLAAAGAMARPAPPRAQVIDPRNVETDDRRAYNLCHADRPGQVDFRPMPEPGAIATTGRAHRYGRVLQVGAARFVDSPPDAEAQTALYSYVGRFAGAPIDLVLVSYYEGDNWILVDRVSGASIKLDGPPHLSPDRRTFASENDSDEFDGYVNIVVFTGRGFTKVETLDLGATCDLAWSGPDRLTLQHAQPDGAPYVEVQLQRAGGRWRLSRGR